MDAQSLTKLGKDLHSRVKTFFDAPLSADATPLELLQAVLDDVERHVQAVGRGRRVFPYTAVAVRVRASEARWPALQATFAQADTRVRERLAEVRCDAPAGLQVTLHCVEEPPAEWTSGQVFGVQYGSATAPARPAVDAGVREPLEAPLGGPAAASTGAGVAASSQLPPLHVAVVKGTATDTEYTFSESTVSIGRIADPTDDYGRVRRNRIAFVDCVDGVNETVGRAHARVRFDPATGSYRLFDEGSRNGTSIVRDGDVIAVHRHDPRGVRLRSGDEIQLGRAVLRLTF